VKRGDRCDIANWDQLFYLRTYLRTYLPSDIHYHSRDASAIEESSMRWGCIAPTWTRHGHTSACKADGDKGW